MSYRVSYVDPSRKPASGLYLLLGDRIVASPRVLSAPDGGSDDDGARAMALGVAAAAIGSTVEVVRLTSTGRVHVEGMARRERGEEATFGRFAERGQGGDEEVANRFAKLHPLLRER